MLFISSTLWWAESTPPAVVETGPAESVFAKKMRPTGRRAAGISSVYVSGVDMNMGCPRR